MSRHGIQRRNEGSAQRIAKRHQHLAHLATNAPSDFEKYISLSKSITLNYLKTADDKRLDTYIVNSPQKDKLETLRDLLIMLNGEPAIVFVSYRESVERVYKYLKQEHFFAEKYHGGMEQRDRERALYKFRSGGSNVLVSTDLAARGLDIAGVKHIVHYHIPTDEAAFEHRNGRSTRWENRGASYVILGPEEPYPPSPAYRTLRSWKSFIQKRRQPFQNGPHSISDAERRKKYPRATCWDSYAKKAD